MKYLFVLGRNPELSQVEILAWCENNNLKLSNIILKDNILLVESDEKINLNKITKDLGGSIVSGEVLFSGRLKEILKFLQEKEIYFGEKIKFFYSVTNLSGEHVFEEVLSEIKSKFKSERLKAMYKPVRGKIKRQDGRMIFSMPTEIREGDENYFVFSDREEIYFGAFRAKFDAEKNEERDMNKPVRRESLAISPRLAKILINLSGVKKGDLLVDPFCGIGGILQEALLREINVIGIDNDKSAISNARQNIEWLKKKEDFSSSYELINQDSRNVELNNFNGAATEPSLGELLTKEPDEENARKIIFRFENLMINVLNNLKKNLREGGKIAFTSPFILSRGKRFYCNFEEICSATGLNLKKNYGNIKVNFPISEFREKQIVGREICVLVKSG